MACVQDQVRSTATPTVGLDYRLDELHGDSVVAGVNVIWRHKAEYFQEVSGRVLNSQMMWSEITRVVLERRPPHHELL